ncbi:MAG: DUF1759 domain-containing protein [Planctomycetaceae bacterium]|nr:DUF1759 domain-containing protein [Planctomycetaceae bacterium]
MATEGDEIQQFERLKVVRRGNRAVVTKLQKEAEKIIREQDGSETSESISRLKSLSVTLTGKQKYLTTLDEEILSKSKIEDLEQEIEETAEWEMKINEILSKIEGFQKEKQEVRPVVEESLRVGGTSPARSRNSEISGSIRSPTRQYNQPHGNAETGVRLPKISLPRFNGDVTKFSSFWQSFECSVHLNEAVSTVNKLNYLLTLLEGPAFKAVEGLELTEDNYEQAVEIL